MTVKSKIVHNDVRFEGRNWYLFAHITGRGEDLETSQGTWRRIAAECKRGGFSKVLILEEIDGEMPFMDQFAFAETLPQLGFEAITVAFVDGKPEQFDNNKFSEDVAVNRGAHGRLFRTIAEAEFWLQHR